jgi:hypothetical protein
MNSPEFTLFLSAAHMMNLKLFPISVPFVCWIHSREHNQVVFEKLVDTILRSDCKSLMISGDKCSELHDFIDSRQELIGNTETVTTWHEGSTKQTAWEFINVDFSAETVCCKIFAAVSKNLETEQGIIKEISGQLLKHLSVQKQ